MDLDDIEAIKQVKYAYFRLLDLKRFDDSASSSPRTARPTTRTARATTTAGRRSSGS